MAASTVTCAAVMVTPLAAVTCTCAVGALMVTPLLSIFTDLDNVAYEAG